MFLINVSSILASNPNPKLGLGLDANIEYEFIRNFYGFIS